MASSHALSPLLEYSQLNLSVFEPAELIDAPSTCVKAPKSRSARVKNTSEPSREAIYEPLVRLRTPKDPVTTAGTLPSSPGSHLRTVSPRPDPERSVNGRQERVRTSREPIYEGQQKRIEAPRSSSTHPHSASELSRDPSPDVRATSKLRGAFQQLISPPDPEELVNERPTHRGTPKRTLASHLNESELRRTPSRASELDARLRRAF